MNNPGEALEFAGAVIILAGMAFVLVMLIVLAYAIVRIVASMDWDDLGKEADAKESEKE